MEKRKIIKYILIAVPVLFLAKWYIETAYYNSNKTPEINPNPQEKLRIYGKFPLDEKKYYIGIVLDYLATNPKCDEINWFEGTRFSRIIYQELNATISDKHYSISINNDKYKNGRCGWIMNHVSLNVLKKYDSDAPLYYGVTFATTNRGLSIYDNNHVLIRAKAPVNFVCNYENNNSNGFINYFCKDEMQNIVSDNRNYSIFLPNSQKEFEVNFDRMAEPIQKNKIGEK